MEWRDEGVILGVRKHGESSAIVEVMTRLHGRHLGMARGARSRAMAPTLQPGNSVAVTWRARLDEHMGAWTLEGTRLRSAVIMESAMALHGVNYLGALARLLPERDPHVALHETIELVADHLHVPGTAPALMVRLELAILSELGFGLDLTECAATGARENLIYVSPKSAKAVSRDAGEPWKDRLLPLPGFLVDHSRDVDALSVSDGFRLTGYFLERDVFGARGAPMPPARHAFVTEAIKLEKSA
jgi:DNA repair protein RecO (recombination protein O)